MGWIKTPDYEMSFETLFEVLMREKNREDLQRLDRGFFEEAKMYIAREKSSLELHEDFHGAVSRVKQLEDMLLEIYSRRERKILSLASIKAKTNADVFDVSAMLDFEKDTFRKIVDILTYNRRLIRSQMKGIKIRTENNDQESIPSKDYTAKNIRSDKNTDSFADSLDSNEYSENASNPPESDIEENSLADKVDRGTNEKPAGDFNNEENAREENTDSEKKAGLEKVNVRFLKPLGKFVGEELETYGPFDEGDFARLPKNIAKVLVNKGEAKLDE